MNGDPDLRALLEEDTGSPEDADALLPVIQSLRRWSVPGVDPVIEPLLAELPESRWADWWPWLLLRAQARVVRGEIWLASLLIVTLGAVVTLAQADPGASGSHVPLAVFAPVAAAIGIAYLYGPEVDPPLEIALATAVSPRLVLLARLALVFGFDLLIGLAASLSVALLRTDLSLWPLVLTWLVPMTFLSALAFCLAALSRQAMLSAVTCFVVWVVQAIGSTEWHLPDLTEAAARPWLLLAAAGLGLVAVWLAGIEERWVGSQQG
jgi:hypothetical protein